MTLARKPAEPGGFSTFRRKRPKPSKRSADPVTPEVYGGVMTRAHGRCEYASPSGWPPSCRGRLHAHHRLPVEHGGRSTPSNLAVLCAGHHDYMHQHPAMGERLGWLVGRRGDPASVAATLGDGTRVLLTDDYRYDTSR